MSQFLLQGWHGVIDGTRVSPTLAWGPIDGTRVSPTAWCITPVQSPIKRTFKATSSLPCQGGLTAEPPKLRVWVGEHRCTALYYTRAREHRAAELFL